jgi:hypothetical protein
MTTPKTAALALADEIENTYTEDILFDVFLNRTERELIIAALRSLSLPQCDVLSESEPVAWIVKWRTEHTPKNASAYLSEDAAKRAAENVRMYAHASDVVVIPTYAASPVPSADQS